MWSTRRQARLTYWCYNNMAVEFEKPTRILNAFAYRQMQGLYEGREDSTALLKLAERYAPILKSTFPMTQLKDYAATLAQALNTLDIDTIRQIALHQVDTLESAWIQRNLIDLASLMHWLHVKGSPVDPSELPFYRMKWQEAEKWYKNELKKFIGNNLVPLYHGLRNALSEIATSEDEVFPEWLLDSARDFLLWSIGVEIQANYRVFDNEPDFQTKLHALLRPEHEAIIAGSAEAKYGLGNKESPIAALWNTGILPQSRRKNWTEIRDSNKIDETVQDTVYHLLNTLDDYTSTADVFEKAADDRLLPSLKKACFYDHLDRKRAEKAQKRQTPTTISKLGDKYDEPKSDDEILAIEGAVHEDEAIQQIEDSVFLKQLVEVPSLTHHEKQVLLIQIQAVETGEALTLEQLGRKLGVSKVRAWQIWDSIKNKLQIFNKLT